MASDGDDAARKLKVAPEAGRAPRLHSKGRFESFPTSQRAVDNSPVLLALGKRSNPAGKVPSGTKEHNWKRCFIERLFRPYRDSIVCISGLPALKRWVISEERELISRELRQS